MARGSVSHLERIALDSDVARALDAFAEIQGIDRKDMIVQILRDWLMAMNALPYHDLEEDTEAAGEA